VHGRVSERGFVIRRGRAQAQKRIANPRSGFLESALRVDALTLSCWIDWPTKTGEFQCVNVTLMKTRMSLRWRWCCLAAFGLVAIGLPTRAATTIFRTGFEVAEGYTNSSMLAGQCGWLRDGNGGNGILSETNAFPRSGQQAYVGQFPPKDTTEPHVAVWQPLDLAAPGLIKFAVDLEIMDSTDGKWDDFSWPVYATNGAFLFSVDLDNNDMGIYYYLEDSTDPIDTYQSFTNGKPIHLEMLLDYPRNQWSAAAGGTVLVTNQPITLTGNLSLGDIDAMWFYYDMGNNYMVFDNYTVLDLRPTLAPLAHTTNRFSLLLQGEPGWRYALDTTPSLPATWTPLTTNAAGATDGSITFTITNLPPPARLYRGRVVP
jgi:hypothetical protein